MVATQEQALKCYGNRRCCDMQCHRLVPESANNLPLMIDMNSLAELELEAISSIDISANVKRHTIHFHQSVLDAIRRADGDAAFETMLRHILDVQSRLGKAFERQLGA